MNSFLFTRPAGAVCPGDLRERVSKAFPKFHSLKTDTFTSAIKHAHLRLHPK